MLGPYAISSYSKCETSPIFREFSFICLSIRVNLEGVPSRNNSRNNSSKENVRLTVPFSLTFKNVPLFLLIHLFILLGRGASSSLLDFELTSCRVHLQSLLCPPSEPVLSTFRTCHIRLLCPPSEPVMSAYHVQLQSLSC